MIGGILLLYTYIYTHTHTHTYIYIYIYIYTGKHQTKYFHHKKIHREVGRAKDLSAPRYEQFYNAQLQSGCVWTHYQDDDVPKLRNTQYAVQRESTATVDTGCLQLSTWVRVGAMPQHSEIRFFVFLLCADICEMKWCDMLHRRWAYTCYMKHSTTTLRCRPLEVTHSTLLKQLV